MSQNLDELLSNKEKPNLIVEKRRKVREQYRFITSKKRTFFVGVMLSWIIIVGFYFYGPQSNVSKVNVFGNYHLPSNYIVEMTGIDDTSKYLLSIPFMIEKKLEQSPLINEAKVSFGNYNMLNVEIIENQIVAYTMDDGYQLLLKSGELVTVDDKLVDIISKVPLVIGFAANESISTLGKFLADVDVNMIENIAEIHRYPVSYDQNMLRILMRDNHHIFTSFFSLDVLNHYYKILPNLEAKQVCLYIDEITKQIYTSNCPWQSDEIIDDESNGENDSQKPSDD